MFAEELGAVIQIAADDHPAVEAVMRAHDLLPYVSVIGAPNATRTIEIRDGATLLYHAPLAALQQQWADVSYHMQALRDNPTCARQEYDALLDTRDPGIQAKPSFDPTARFAINGTRPRVAILREQGINGHVETAAAFDRAGFECVDVHMTDLSAGRTSLAQFAGLAVCGGFSYGDVLGAGTGWAKSILYNERLKEMFAAFFARPGTFTLGVCNGCQMLTQLKEIIPGAHDWPLFARNASEQFEARYVTVEVLRSPSIFFKDMAGSLLPIPSSHGEGRADFSATGARDALERNGLVAMRFVDNFGTATERYPFNPNGSPGGITGLTTPDGRVTVMMPHPERLFRAVQMSYRPHGTFAGEEGPWLRMFQNARAYVG
jgi:phosphoribosylformylglycinamidine synthase